MQTEESRKGWEARKSKHQLSSAVQEPLATNDDPSTMAEHVDNLSFPP